MDSKKHLHAGREPELHADLTRRQPGPAAAAAHAVPDPVGANAFVTTCCVDAAETLLLLNQGLRESGFIRGHMSQQQEQWLQVVAVGVILQCRTFRALVEALELHLPHAAVGRISSPSRSCLSFLQYTTSTLPRAHPIRQSILIPGKFASIQYARMRDITSLKRLTPKCVPTLVASESQRQKQHLLYEGVGVNVAKAPTQDFS